MRNLRIGTLSALLGLTTASIGSSQFGSESLWTCSAASGSVTLDTTTLSYSYEISGQTWLEQGDYVVHCGGYYSWLQGGLKLLSASAINGTDPTLGEYEGYSLTFGFAVPSSTCNWPVQMKFRCFSDVQPREPGSRNPGDVSAAPLPFISFDTTFPIGASGPISTDAETVVSPASYNTSKAPLTHFPSWAADDASFLQSGQLSHIEWAGTFAWQEQNAGVGLHPLVGPSPSDGSLANYSGGQTGGPVVLHETTWQRGPGAAGSGKPLAVYALPMAQFKHSILALHADVSVPAPAPPAETPLRWVFGPQGRITSLPANWTTSLGLFASPNGVTDVVMGGGATLQRLYNTSRLSLANDPGSAYVSLWTDQGAFYDWDYFAQPAVLNSSATPAAAVLNSLYSSWASKCVSGAACAPPATIQLDPWFYINPANGALTNWTADTALFGSAGLTPLISAGMRFTLYSSFWAPAAQVTMPPFTFENSDVFSSWLALPFSQVAPEQSAAFHSMLVHRGSAWGMAGYETDFLDWSFMGIAAHQTTPGRFEQWLSGMDNALAGSITPLQMCMGLPSDALFSVQLLTPTSFRASQDNDPHYAPPTRWTIGTTSLLLASLGLRPYFDVTWTQAAFPPGPGPAPAGGYPNSVYGNIVHNSTELALIMATLSTGPVGIGDAIGATNATLLRVATRSDGMLLKPGRPLTSMDIQFGSRGLGARAPAPAYAMQAPTWLPCSSFASVSASCGAAPWVNLVLADIADDAPVTIYPSDVTPDLSANWTEAGVVSYVAVPWSPGLVAMRQLCGDQANASGCVQAFSDTSPLVVSTGSPIPVPAGMKGEGLHPFEMFTLHPVSAAGFALLGCVDKAARVSPQRFTSVAYGAASITITVIGAPGETLTVAVLLPPLPNEAPGPDVGDITSFSSVPGRISAPTFVLPSTGYSAGKATLSCTSSGCNVF